MWNKDFSTKVTTIVNKKSTSFQTETLNEVNSTKSIQIPNISN